MLVGVAGAEMERDLTWLDLSFPADLSPDGRVLLFTEEGGPTGVNYAVCLRQTDRSPVVQLGEGNAAGLSPDGKWALATVPTSPDRLMLYPTGPGEPRRLDSGEIEHYSRAQWFADGLRILVCGNEVGRASRCYVKELAGGPPKPVTPDGMVSGFISPDARFVLARGTQGEAWMCPLDSGAPKRISVVDADDVVVGWTPDGGSVLAYDRNDVPARLERIDLATGHRTLVRLLGPPDLTGIIGILSTTISNDGRSYVYSPSQYRSQLFLVQGAR